MPAALETLRMLQKGAGNVRPSFKAASDARQSLVRPSGSAPLARLSMKGPDASDFERKPIALFKPLDYLNRGQYAVLNPLRRLTDRKNSYSLGDYAGSVWKGITGKERSQTTDVLDNLGWRPTSLKGKIARGLVGFVGDIALDPLTYVPFANLTKFGKAAKAGRLLKIGDASLDLAKPMHLKQATDLLAEGMTKAGQNADDIAKAVGAFRGIKSAGIADDMASALGKYGIKSEAVKLAPTWAKQFKAGQRSLLQLEAPRILGGGSVSFNPLNVIGSEQKITKKAIPGVKYGWEVIKEGGRLGDKMEEAIFNAATWANRRLQAGRMIANPDVWKSIPQATKEMNRSARNGNLVKVGGELYDLGSRSARGKVRSALFSKLAEAGADERTMKSAQGFLGNVEQGTTGLADMAARTLKGYGIDAEKASLHGLRNQKVAAKFGRNAVGLGTAANRISSAFNIIPTAVKKIRRYAAGASNAAQEHAITGIKEAIGEDGFEKLAKGLADDATAEVIVGGKIAKVGKDDILRLRLEAIEGLGNTVVRREIANKIRAAKAAGRELTADDLADALEIVRAGTDKAKGNLLNRFARMARPDISEEARAMADARKTVDTLKSAGLDDASREVMEARRAYSAALNAAKSKAATWHRTARRLEGLDTETVSRMQKTIKDWGNVADIQSLGEAARLGEEASTKMGAIQKAVAHNRMLTEGLGYIPRHKIMDGVEEVAVSAGGRAPQEAREFSHGKTIFEASQGYRSPTATRSLMDNADKTIMLDSKGRPITGRDILGSGFGEMERQAGYKRHGIWRAQKMADEAAARGAQADTKAAEMASPEAVEQARKAAEEKFSGVSGVAQRDLDRAQAYGSTARGWSEKAGEQAGMRQMKTAEAKDRLDEAFKNFDANPTVRNERELQKKMNAYEKAGRMQRKAEERAGRLEGFAEGVSRGEARRMEHLQKMQAVKARRIEREMKNYERAVSDARNYAEYLNGLARNRKASIEDLQKGYDDFLKRMEETVAHSEAVQFSTDLKKGLLSQVGQAQRRMQTRLTMEGVAKYGVPIKDGAVPYGYVKASDVFSQGAFREMLSGAETSGEFADIVKTFGNEKLADMLQNTAIPHQYVAPLKEMMNLSRPNLGTLAKIHDWGLSILKPFMLSSPATQMRNTASSFAMAWAAGDFARPLQGMDNFRKCLAFCSGGFGKGDTVDIGGRAYTMEDLWKIYEQHSGASMGRIATDFLATPPEGVFGKAGDMVQKGTRWINKPTSAIAEATENTFRFNHFINELQKGSTIGDAVESVALHFYDYGDLSKFEQTVLRRIFPFYTFFRKNMEANLRYIVSNMGYAKAPQVVANNVNSMSEGHPEAIPTEWLDNERSQWLAKQGAFRLPWNPSKFATMQGILPQADAAVFMDPSEGMQTVLGMISPMAKMPYELATNKDTFTGRDIKTPTNSRVLYNGLDLDPRIVHMVKPFRLFDVTDRVSKKVFPEWAQTHGVTMRPGMSDGTRMQRLGRAVGEGLGFKSYQQDRDTVRQDMAMELGREIRRLEDKLARFPNLVPKLRKIDEDKLRELKERREKLGL